MSSIKVKTTFKDVLNFLDKEDTTIEQRNILINHFIRHINAFPLEEIVETKPNGIIYINGRELTPEMQNSFFQGISALNGNASFRLILEQIAFKAIKKGLHESVKLEDQYFAKSALFFIDLFKQYLDKLNLK